MMLHTSAASTNESFSQWSTHGTALHLIIPADEQAILDQISGWKVTVEEEMPNSLSRASQHLVPQSSHLSAPVEPCSIAKVSGSTSKKVQESIQKSGRSALKSLHKTVPSLLTANKNSHSRRYSLGDAELFIKNVLGMTKLKRSHSWPELCADAKNSSLSESVNISSKISSRVNECITNENNRLKMLSSASQVDDETARLLSFSTNLEEIRKLSTNGFDNTEKGLIPKMKHQAVSKDKDSQKSPYKSPKKYVNSVTKKSKINVKKRILSPIKDIEENETSNILDNADVQPSKKQKIATLSKPIEHNDFENKVTMEKSVLVKDNGTSVTILNKHIDVTSNLGIADAINVQPSSAVNQPAFRNDLKHASDNEDEIQSNVNESVESLAKEPFSPLKHSTPMIFDLPNNDELHNNNEIALNKILPHSHTLQNMQDPVQNIANVDHQNASPSDANRIYSQPEIFKDPDDSQSIIPNSDSIKNSNLDVNSSMVFLHRDSIGYPRSQLPPEIMLTEAQSKFTSSNIPPEMVLSNISWGNSSLQIQPEVTPSQIPPKIKVSPETVNPQIHAAKIITASIPHKRIASPNMPLITPEGLLSNSVAGANVISSPLKSMPTLVPSGSNDHMKQMDSNKQCSTPVGEKTSQDLFPIHVEDFMNISSSGSIPCGQKQKSFSYISSQPLSQDSISEKIASATPSGLQVGSAQKVDSFISSPRCLPQTDKITTNMNDTYTISHANSAQNHACRKIVSKSPAAQLQINSSTQQISKAELASKVLAARKKLVFQERERQTQLNEPHVPTNISSKRKRKLSNDLKTHSHKKGKFISVTFESSDVKSILDNMREIY